MAHQTNSSLNSESRRDILNARLIKFSHDTLTPRMVGFALSRAWFYVVFFNAAYIIVNPESQTVNDMIYVVTLAVLVGVLLIGGAVNQACEEMAQSTTGHILPALLCVIGTSFLPIAGLQNSLGVTAVIISAFMSGIGSGLFVLFWGRIYSTIGGPTAAAETSVAYILAGLLVPLFVVLPFVGQIVLVTVLPILSTPIMVQELNRINGILKGDTANPPETSETLAMESTKTSKAASKMSMNAIYDQAKTQRASRKKPETEPLKGDWKQIMIKLIISSIVFGGIVSLVQNIYASLSPGAEQTATSTSFSIILPIAALVAGTIMLAVLLFSKRLDLAFSYRPVLIFMSLGCLLLPFFEQSGTIAYFLTMTGYICFEIINWVILSDFSFRFDRPAYRVFGYGRAAVSGGVFLGAVLGTFLKESVLLSPQLATAISLAMVFIMIVTYTFTFTERDVARITNESDTFAYNQKVEPDLIEQPQEKHELTFDEKLVLTAEKYGISGRALEVMDLFAHGRTGTRIEQELYISRGTVNTHLRNLYQKLGVHSRQEMLDLIDNITEP